jgi:rubrerythrin
MTDEPKAGHHTPPVITPVRSALSPPPCDNTDKMICERCGEEMYRMHAVWRCPACRFKTDCCGW